MEIYLKRMTEANGAMMGRLFVPGIAEPLFTLEDPWKDNQMGVSCIPAGTYECRPHGWEDNSPVHMKRVWELVGVPGRSAILIHVGNTTEDTKGCILVGMSMALMNFPKPAAQINQSAVAVDKLRAKFPATGFTIRIENP